MEPNRITDQAGTGGGGASRRRPLLASLTTLGVVTGLLGVAGVFAAGSDTATTGENDIESGEIERREADIQLASASFGLSDPEQHLTVECNDDWSDDLATGVLSGDVDQFDDYDFTMGVLCLRNVGTEAVDVAWSTFDVVDEELACSTGEEDGACGDLGELSQHLTIDLGDNLGDEPLCRIGTPTTPAAAAEAATPLVTLEPGQTVGLCTHALWDGDASSQTDRVRFRLRFEAVTGDVTPPPECRDDALEEDDTVESATAYAGPVSGQLCSGDQDWFTYEHTGDDLQVRLEFDDPEDLDFYVYDANGVEAFRGWTLDNPELQASELPAGTYAVLVDGEGPAQSPYTLTISSLDLPDPDPEPPVCADDAFEDNDSIDQATPVAAGEVQGTICSGDDDFFAYEHQGGELRVDLTFVHAVGDLDLEVFGPDGTSVGTSAGVDDTESVVIAADAAQAGTYVVRVHGYQGDAGDYTLAVGTSILLPPPGGGETIG